MIPILPAVGRLEPVVRPVAQAWSLFTISQVAEAVAGSEPSRIFSPALTWLILEMLLAALVCRVFWSVSTGDVSPDPSTGLGWLAKRARLALIGLAALLIAVLAALVVSHRPAILLPVLGLALTYPGWSAALRREVRA